MNRPESYSRRLFRTVFNSRLRLASSRTIELQERVNELEKDVQQLSLLSLALMTLLEEQGSLAPGDLDGMMEAIDGADGQIDGRVDISEYMKRLRDRPRPSAPRRRPPPPAARDKSAPRPPPGGGRKPHKKRTLPSKAPRHRNSSF